MAFTHQSQTRSLTRELRTIIGFRPLSPGAWLLRQRKTEFRQAEVPGSSPPPGQSVTWNESRQTCIGLYAVETRCSTIKCLHSQTCAVDVGIPEVRRAWL
jgi:hypothetical protein